MRKTKIFPSTLFKFLFISAIMMCFSASLSYAGVYDYIVINEVAHSGAQRLEDEDGERQDWIEIYNNTSASLSLEGVYLSDDSDNNTKWEFPSMSIAPGEFLVIFASGKDKKDPSGNLHTNFRLSSGEPVILFHEDDGVLDYITSSQSQNVPENHSIGRLPDGTGSFTHFPIAAPGYPNIDPASTFPGVIINEIMSSNSNTLEFLAGSGEYPDWIELYNPLNFSVDLNGYQISDDNNTWTFTTPLSIPAKGYLLVYANGQDAANPPQTDFKLSRSGETVTLRDNLGNVIDQVVCPELITDHSYGRYPTGGVDLEHMADPSPGSANQSSVSPANPDARYLRINEIVSSNKDTIADSDGDYGDWIELYNTSSTVTVNLRGLVIGDDGAKWQFPTDEDIYIAPKGYIIVWANSKDKVVDLAGGGYEFHTNFNISSAGETITLYNTDWATVVDTVDMPGVPRDSSWGRYPDGSDTLREMSGTTPMGENSYETVLPNDTAHNIVINEIVTNNTSGITDRDGDHVGWVELYNKGDSTVDLAGLRLSDGVSVWAFPEGRTLGAGEYMIVFVSGKTRTGRTELATNFEISAEEGGTLMLVNRDNPDFTLIETVNVPPLGENISWGRYPDGTGAFYERSGPTPGATNGTAPLDPGVEYYASGRVKSRTYDPPEDGVVYEEYLDEALYGWGYNWRRQASGYSSRVSRQVLAEGDADRDGAIAFRYEYPAVGILTADLDGGGNDNLVIEYSFGIYEYLNGSLNRISQTVPEELYVARLNEGTKDSLILEYGFGLYEYLDGSLHRISQTLPNSVQVATLNDQAKEYLVIEYDFGLYEYLDGSLNRISQTLPNAIWLADLNGDGKDNLTIEYDFGLFKYAGASLSRISQTLPQSVYAADLGGEGEDSLIIEYSFGFYEYAGGSLNRISQTLPNSVQVATLNDQGKEYLVIEYDFGLYEYLDGSLNRISQTLPNGILLADLNGDGKDNLIIEYDSGLHVYVDGEITRISQTIPNLVEVAKLNDQGKECLVIEYDFGLYEYLDGSLNRISQTLPNAICLADLNGDGKDNPIMEYDFGLNTYVDGEMTRISTTLPDNTATEYAYSDDNFQDLIYVANYDGAGNIVDIDHQNTGPDSLGLFLGEVSGQGYVEESNIEMEVMAKSAVHALKGVVSGGGVKLALIDSGIDAEKLGEAVSAGIDFTGSGSWNDMLGHGTAAAEVINFTARDAELLALKALDASGSTTTGIVSNAIRYAADMGARIVAMPFGMSLVTDQIRKSIEYAANKGSILIASAGNNGSKIEDSSLAAQESVITVGALDNDGKMSAWSNTGEEVDLYAPWDIIGNDAGTSFSTAYVAGVAALLLEETPDMGSEELLTALQSIFSTINTGEEEADSPVEVKVEEAVLSRNAVLLKNQQEFTGYGPVVEYCKGTQEQ